LNSGAAQGLPANLQRALTLTLDLALSTVVLRSWCSQK